MTHAEALDLAWGVGVTVVRLLGFFAVVLVGFAVVGQIRR